MEIRNRIVMAPMTSGYSSLDGFATRTLTDFYAARARGGVGLITCESCYVTKKGKGFQGHLALDEDRYIPDLSTLTKSVKSAGAKVVLQLIHCGRQTTPALCGGQPLAASAIPCPVLKEMPREATLEEIQEIIEAFVAAAERAKEAGFDGVEVHAAHGYLINQFLSPYSNRRNDDYGGDLWRRSRLLLEIVSGIKKSLGADYPVLCRLSSDEFVDGGLTLTDTRLVAHWLQNIGLDALSISGGVYESADRIIPPMDVSSGSLVELAAGIKQAVTLPVITVGGINDPSFADRILTEGKADMVAIGRALLADPDWPSKARDVGADGIRPCLYCNHCRNRAIRPKINCAVNYRTGREGETATKTSRSPNKKVVVIGGGISGMAAAAISSERGHRVSLFERSEHLGGNLLIASVPPHRSRLLKIIDFFRKELTRHGVSILMNSQITPNAIRKEKPDVVFLATGSKPILPDLPGIHKPHVHPAAQVLNGEATLGKYVVVLGGGLVGLETADYLRAKGCAVIILEKRPAVGNDPNVEAIFQKFLIGRLTRTDASVLILTSTEATEIGPDYVKASGPAGERILPGIESVVVAAGFEPHVPIGMDAIPADCQVHLIGDAMKPQTLFEAIHSASRIAYGL